MGISIHSLSKEIIWNKASEFLINWLKFYHNITQKTLVLLSGGSCVKIYRNLEEFIGNYGGDFSFLAFAQVDERKYNRQQRTENREQINAYQIEKTGLWKVCKKKKIPYYSVSQEGILEQSAEQYNKIIEKLFKEYVYKIAVLGIGEDGHTAGLLPGYEKVWNRESMVVGYENKGKFRQRISLTPKALRQLDQAIVVATGERKKRVIKNLLEQSDKILIAILYEIPKVDLFTDIKID